MDTWQPGTDETAVAVIVEQLKELSEQVLDGVTISGGEPFDQPNGLAALLEALSHERLLREADVLVYSGYTLTQLHRRYSEILGRLDALMSGPFVASLPTELPWRGSSNQRLNLFTERARERFSDPQQSLSRSLQVSADGGQLWLTGIPRPGDLEQFERTLGDRGIELGDVSWRA